MNPNISTEFLYNNVRISKQNVSSFYAMQKCPWRECNLWTTHFTILEYLNNKKDERDEIEWARELSLTDGLILHWIACASIRTP